MTISVFRWTDGPYLAFDDRDKHRYLLQQERAVTLLDRMRSHLCPAPDRTLVANRRFFPDPARDLTVIEIYLQDCDNLFEVITSTGPILQATAIEIGTILWLATDPPLSTGSRPRRSRPAVTIDPAIVAAINADSASGFSLD